jgi:hypothetical protein
MSRDAAAAVAGWKDQVPPDLDRRKLDVQHVVRLLCLSLLWGFIARQAMGQHPEKSDVDQLQAIAGVMKTVLGETAFRDLFEVLPRRDALGKFFGVADNTGAGPSK